MKRIYFTILSVLLLTSCNYKEDDNFSQKPFERINKAIDTYKNTLEGYDGYWLLDFFPDKNRIYGGYNFLVKFKNGEVTAASELNVRNNPKLSKEYKSYYTFSATEGPMLSFDTNNPVLHHFSTPSSQFNNARGGDFEFIFISHSDDKITLRGRKNENVMTLTKLSEDKLTFLNKITANAEAFASKGLSPISVGGKQVTLGLAPSYRQLSFQVDGNTQTEAFIFTEKGFRLYSPVSVNGVTFTEFYLSDDKKTISTPDGTISSTLLPSPLDNSLLPLYFWTEEGYVSDEIVNLYKQLQNEERKHHGGIYQLEKGVNFVTMYGNDNISVTGFYLYIYNTRTKYYSKAYYEADFTGTNNTNEINFIKKDGNSGWGFFKYYLPMIDLITENAPYTITDGGRYKKLTSVKNPTIWFDLYPGN